MKLVSLGAQNFKSFGSIEVSIKLDESLNTIVGENNVGKSNILRIYQKIYSLLLQPNNLTDEDYHNGNNENHVKLKLNVVLEDDDIEFLMSLFGVPLVMKSGFDKIFGKELNIDILISKPLGIQFNIKFGLLFFNQSYATFRKFDPAKGTQPFNWNSIIANSNDDPNKLYTQITDILNINNPNAQHGLQFNQNPLPFFASLLSQKIIVFSEFRTPTQTVSNSPASPNLGLATLLYDLKNGSVGKRKRFELIKDKFSAIFPHLKLDAINGPQIVIAKTDSFEVRQESISAGIIEMINILANLIALENYVFILDEPELHLHPHAKRTISGIIKESSAKNQIICITHSTHFIFMDSIEQITLVRDVSGESKVIKIVDDYFNEEETKKILRITSPEQKEFLFARGVLLVEGDTEFGAIPIFAKKLGHDLDQRNISIISADSHFFATFVKMLRGFQIPYFVMCDRDSLTHIEDHIKIDGKKIKTSSLLRQLYSLGNLQELDLQIILEAENNIKEVMTNGKKEYYYDDQIKAKLDTIINKFDFLLVLNSDFEGLFQDPKYEQTIKDAKQKFNRSKVLIGKFIAENAIDMPQELTKVIQKITNT